ncbi:MAG: hypothetical protein M3220_10605, partial [Chloroflexota bacterium]|nr:hypothetical protein [Chloroflexota bacterium]
MAIMTRSSLQNVMLFCSIVVSLALASLSPLASASVWAQEPLPPPPPERDGRFGAVEAYDAPHIADAAGVGWTRVLFWWHQMQPAGIDDWNVHYFPDHLLNQERAAGREMVGLLAGTAAWASESGSPRAVPSGLYLPYDHPDNLWGQFVSRIVRRYAGEIDRWIIWNEPDIWDDKHDGKTWNGTIEEYVQLLKVAYQAAKAANGNAVIHLTATTYWWDTEHGREPYFPQLLDAIRAEPDAARLNGFFDVASLHIYFKPEQVYDLTMLYRQELARHGFADKPLWINETNAPPSTDPLHPAPGLRFPISLEQQSHFLVQSWAMGLAAGAERVSLYKTRDERSLPVGVEPYGMMRKDGSVRPVFWTYRALVTYLGGYQDAHLYRESDIRRVVVSRGQKGSTTVVWNTGLDAQSVRVPATAESARIVDPYGGAQHLVADGGFYTLTLPPSRGGEIGGTPYMIVEGDGAQVELEVPEEMQIALPAPSDTPLPAVPVVVPVGPSPHPLPPLVADWALPNGRFFTQSANGQGGFSVIDDEQARFWSEFQRLGGLQTVGYPISRRFVQDGFVTQVFQKLALQWRPEVGQAWPINIFDELSKAGFDDALFDRRQTPRPLNGSEFDPPGVTWPVIVSGRQALLN